MFFLASIGRNDEYRKPSPSMWTYFTKTLNSDLQIDFSKSFYCGDAAGRPKDHSNDDRMFAKNNGLNFHTPESFFLEQPLEEP